jgi:hypothetical protein
MKVRSTSSHGVDNIAEAQTGNVAADNFLGHWDIYQLAPNVHFVPLLNLRMDLPQVSDPLRSGRQRGTLSYIATPKFQPKFSTGASQSRIPIENETDTSHCTIRMVQSRNFRLQ